MANLISAFRIYLKTPQIPFTSHLRQNPHDQIALIHRNKIYENFITYISTDKRKSSVFGERLIHTYETGILCILTLRITLVKMGMKSSVETDHQYYAPHFFVQEYKERTARNISYINLRLKYLSDTYFNEIVIFLLFIILHGIKSQG